MSTSSTPPEQSTGGPDSARWLYWAVGAVVVVLVVLGLATWTSEKRDQDAQAKAQALTQKFEAAGLPVPVNQKMITRWLGNDGGAVCDNPASALGKATLNDQITNGADFVGRRPVIIDRKVLLGEALILQTYCPEKFQEYQDKIDDLKTDDTIKN